jgi:hypothetical protein
MKSTSAAGASETEFTLVDVAAKQSNHLSGGEVYAQWKNASDAIPSCPSRPI